MQDSKKVGNFGDVIAATFIVTRDEKTSKVRFGRFAKFGSD